LTQFNRLAMPACGTKPVSTSTQQWPSCKPCQRIDRIFKKQSGEKRTKIETELQRWKMRGALNPANFTNVFALATFLSSINKPTAL